jgi:hypothetical protein
VVLVSAPLAAVLVVGAVAGTAGAPGAGAIANPSTAPLPAVFARVDDL